MHAASQLPGWGPTDVDNSPARKQKPNYDYDDYRYPNQDPHEWYYDNYH